MKKKHKSLGLAPGSIIFTGNQKVDKVIIHYLNYNEKFFKEDTINTHEKVTFLPSDDNEIDYQRQADPHKNVDPALNDGRAPTKCFLQESQPVDLGSTS